MVDPPPQDHPLNCTLILEYALLFGIPFVGARTSAISSLFLHCAFLFSPS